ncbi:MAG: DUF1906 domain-containing protein [Micrococcaceae bacterium]
MMQHSELILTAQRYLNSSYGNQERYYSAVEDGKQRVSNFSSATFAVQKELGVSEPTGACIADTFQKAQEQCKNLATVPQKLLDALRCAFIFKGYFPATIGQAYAWQDDAALRSFAAALGVPDTFLPGKLIGTLLYPAYAVSTNESDNEQVVQAQKWLNRVANNSLESSYILPNGNPDPSQGYLARRFFMNQVGITDGNASDSGQKMIDAMNNSQFKLASGTQSSQLTTLLQSCLCIQGFPVDLTGDFDSATETALRQYQNFARINITGECDGTTWASLLYSAGDKTRAGDACDTITPITEANLPILKDNGIKYVARYLNGNASTPQLKILQEDERDFLEKNDMKVIPIYQVLNNEVKYFSYELGKQSAETAIKQADYFGFSSGTIIFFTVDYDANPDDIEAAIIPYFQGVKDNLGKYKLGVYGPRWACIRVSDEVEAEQSFVAAYSNNYMGNDGMPLPKNWALLQGPEKVLSGHGVQINVDVNYSSELLG